MLFSTTTQYAVLLLVLVAGWLFGLASHPGGRKWKARYEAERDAHHTTRADGDTRLRDSDQRVAQAEARARSLETDLTRERNQRPYVADPAIAPARKPVYISDTDTTARARSVADDGRRREWFDFGR